MPVDVMRLEQMTATELVRGIKSGSFGAIDIAEAIIARHAARDADVRAWVHFDPDYIRSQALELDRTQEKGALHGVPIGIKDVINTADMPTEHNSLRYSGSRPGVDAAAVDILRASGALIVGKTVTTEFAATNRGGKTRNPRDLRRTPGGSSSGSAAAVADFQVTLALGTQTTGSTIRPGSYNGVFALKPTWSSISIEGSKTYVVSADTIGLFSRAAEDLELLADVFRLDAIEGKAPKDLSEAHVAVCRTMDWVRAEPATHRAMQGAISVLKAAGAKVVELELPVLFDAFPDAEMKIRRRESRASFLNQYCTTPGLHDEFKARVENRDGFSSAEIRDAYAVVDRCRAAFDDIVKEYGFVLAPSASSEAPLGLETTGEYSFNGLWSMLQVPVVTVPGFVGPSGMPVGLSLIGRRYEDRRLLSFARLVGAAFRG